MLYNYSSITILKGHFQKKFRAVVSNGSLVEISTWSPRKKFSVFVKWPYLYKHVLFLAYVLYEEFYVI